MAVPFSLAGCMLADAWSGMGAAPKGERLKRMTRSPQYRDGRFHNRLKNVDPALGAALRSWFGGDQVREPTQELPVLLRTTPELSGLPATGLRLTWFGHSSMLIEIDGLRVLTDPVWGERASPLTWLGPKRFHPPPIALGALPQLDAVLISHDHYDHLDEPSIRELAKTGATFFTPLGVGAHLEYWGVSAERIVELDWWEKRKLGDVEVVATPSRHFSGRGFTDRDRTLWASWSLLGPKHRAFFSGDTGMFPGFEEIGRRLGPFDATMLEVGAYNQLWSDVHLGPEQAAQAHQVLRGKVLFPVHWGTFNLAVHAWTEPVERLLVAAKKAGIRTTIPRPGQSIEPAALPELERWWPEIPWQTAQQEPVVSTGLGGWPDEQRDDHAAPVESQAAQ